MPRAAPLASPIQEIAQGVPLAVGLHGGQVRCLPEADDRDVVRRSGRVPHVEDVLRLLKLSNVVGCEPPKASIELAPDCDDALDVVPSDEELDVARFEMQRGDLRPIGGRRLEIRNGTCHVRSPRRS